LNNLAQVLYVRGDLDGAADLYQESLALQEQLGDVHGKATTLSNLALIYFARGDLDGALPLLQESLALREQLGDVRGKAKTLNNLAQIYTARDDLDGALALYQESLSILEQLDDLQGKSAVLNDMARACSSSGDLERAFRFYQESLDVLKRIDLENQAMRTRAILAQIGYKLGRQYVEQGRWYDALSLFEKSLSVYRQGDDLDMRADVIYQIARTHHLLGNLDKARTHYRDAARLYAHTQNQLGVATCRTGLGRLMIQMGFVNDAIRALESARQIYEKLGEKKRVDEVKDVLRVAYRVKEKNGL
jgi:tetratricopeptide (TPR) repeat protein